MQSSRDRNKERLYHIIVAIDKICDYTVAITYEEFEKDSRCNEAVMFQLFIIGEAINHVDVNILERYPYPWHMVKAQRNVIAHEYFGIRLDKIWNVIRNDLSDLKSQITEIIRIEFLIDES